MMCCGYVRGVLLVWYMTLFIFKLRGGEILKSHSSYFRFISFDFIMELVADELWNCVKYCRVRNFDVWDLY